MTARDAAKMTDATAHDAAISAMLPFCLEQSRLDPERAEKMAAISASSTYQRRDALLATGWTTALCATAANRDLAEACQEGLKSDAS